MLIVVYFQGRSTHTLVYFQGRPARTCSSWSIFRGDRPTLHPGLFSGATCPHMFIVVYFQGDLPTHVHRGLFSGVTSPHTHTGLFSWATCPHMFIVVYFQGRPAHTCSSWSIFRGDRPTHSHWSIFKGDLPTHVHPGLFSWVTGPHTHMVYFHERPTLTLTLVFFSSFFSLFFFENFLMLGFFSLFFPFQGHNNDSLLLSTQ